MQRCIDSSLTEDVYLTGAELGFFGTDSEERLNRIVRKGGDLGVDAVASELLNVRPCYMPLLRVLTHIVQLDSVLRYAL